MSLSDDLLDLARIAIESVAVIVTQVGVKYDRNKLLCSRLGFHLLRTAEFLDIEGSYQSDKIKLRIPKLLRDIENICTWPSRTSEISYALLENIANTPPDSKAYEVLQAQVENGVAKFTLRENMRACCEIMVNLEKFVGKTSRPGEDADLKMRKKRQRDLPPMYATEINSTAYRMMREHTFCTCNISSSRGRHLTQLLLRPMEDFSPDHITFGLLISSAPIENEYNTVRWQDVKLSVSKEVKSRRQARFSDGAVRQDMDSSETSVPISRGGFCRLITQDKAERICLDVRMGTLYHCGFEIPKRIVGLARDKSLAEILGQYRLTPRMKLTLAYIVAYSTWRYYDSDWMKTRWTSDSLRFIEERETAGPPSFGNWFVWKPYLSVRLGTEDLDFDELSSTAQIHLYPRIRALGMILIEIGLGEAIRVQDTRRVKLNGEYMLGLESLENPVAWKVFDYSDYNTAIKSCFDVELFKSASINRDSAAEELPDGLNERRAMVYENIVFPLEDLLRKLGWLQQINKIGPLVASSKNIGRKAPADRSLNVTDNVARPQDKSAGKLLTNPLSNSQKQGYQFLNRIKRLNEELKPAGFLRKNGSSIKRVRIAILDTGYDDDAPFFFVPAHRDRLKGCKDFTGDPCGSCQDVDGHGTFAVSLTMKVAPEADVYVARVSVDAESLQRSSENVAKAISWASTEWEADIISMSFGYEKEQRNISNAIYKSLSDRDGSVLFFAAASNDGSNSEEMWPARHDSVISIRGTDFNGQFQGFNPPTRLHEAASFGTLGVDVRSAWLSDQDDEVFRSGTSVATVIAAGIAGILLEYVRGRLSDTDTLGHSILQRLQTREGMLAMFLKLSSETLNHRCWYLAPWKLMGDTDTVRWARFIASQY